MIDTVQQNYNKFTYLPVIPYKVVSYLINENDLIWRLLQYNDSNAWKLDADHPNLTKAEKGLLIYDGLRSQNNCRVFLEQGQDDAFVIQSTILRISVVEMIPTNYVWGHISVAFEIFSHFKVNQLSNYQLRMNMIAQQLLETFNGADLGDGIGRLYFDYSRNSKSKMILIGKQPYKGIGLLMCNHALG